jgi:CheY-like chemotaxis protein
LFGLLSLLDIRVTADTSAALDFKERAELGAAREGEAVVEEPARSDPSPAPPLQALLVEDDPADARLLEEACRALPRAVRLRRVSTGDAALRALEGARGARPPDVVILDLNLPRMDGRAVLARIRANPSLRTIPVIILTASTTDDDVLRAFDLEAVGYLRKPVDHRELARALDRIGPARSDEPGSASPTPG